MDISVWKKAKKEQKMTFDELSQKSGVPKRTLEDVFSGRTQEPRLSTIEAIERALGINEKSPTAQDAQPGVKIPDSIKKVQLAFFEGLDGLSEESVQDVLKYIEYVKAKEKEKK